MNKTRYVLRANRLVYAIVIFLIFMSIPLSVKVYSQGNPDNHTAIALIRASNLYVMDSDGSNQRQLTSMIPGPTDHPSWSPSGRKLAFDAVVNNKPNGSSANANIFMTEIDNVNPINLTNSNGYDNLLPVWSPKGDKIAFVSNRSGNWQIFLMNVDGTDQVRLTSGEADDGIHGLTWSPDGSKIVFVSNRDQGRNLTTGNYEDENLYLVDVPEDTDGFAKIEILNLTSPIHQCPAGENYLNPVWSKDNQLAFAALDCTINWDIFTFSIDVVLAGKTKDIQYFNLTRRVNEDGALGLSWSPDASRIIFVSNYPEVTNATSEDIFVVDVTETLKTNTPQIVQVTNDPDINNSYGFPTWQPEFSSS